MQRTWIYAAKEANRGKGGPRVSTLHFLTKQCAILAPRTALDQRFCRIYIIKLSRAVPPLYGTRIWC
jgi:hypothetical protein